MPSDEQIAQTVKEYVRLAGSGTSDDLAVLYADDATVEDPVGSDVHSGIDAIRAFYGRVMDGREFFVHLVSLNVCGTEAAFHFQVTSDARRMDVIETMTFDATAKITTMRAYWGRANVIAV